MIPTYRDPGILRHGTSARLAETNAIGLYLTGATATVAGEEISIVTTLARRKQPITAIGLGPNRGRAEYQDDEK